MTLAPPVHGVVASHGSRPVPRRGYHLAVDLGTTFVAAAICDGGRPEMLTLGGRSAVVPSVVCCDDDGKLLCGEAAARQALVGPARAARDFKRRLGDPTPLRLGERTWAPAELLAALLGDVLRVVIETQGAPPEQVMLTRPASWGPLRRKVFAEVAELAGLGVVPMVTEPEAVAVHYATSRDLTEGQLVAVYDLGGGTFDTTLLRAHPDRVGILGVPEGIERLGGIDFDDALFAHLDHACDGALSALDVHDPRTAVALARVRQDVVLAKEHLSVDPAVVIPVFLPERSFEVRVTRTTFEDLVRARVESTVGALERTLDSARVSVADLDAVLLAGGSSRMPLVAQMITEALGRPVAVDTHPKYAVALGAATLAARADPGPDTAAAPAEVPVETAGTRAPRPRTVIEWTGQGWTVAGAGSDGHPDRRGVMRLRVEQALTLRLGDSSAPAVIELIPSSAPPADTPAETARPGPPDIGDTPPGPTRTARHPAALSLAGLLVAVLASAGVVTAGYLGRGPAPPAVRAAPPVAACTANCDTAARPSPPAAAPAVPGSPCPGPSPMPLGCASPRPLPHEAEGKAVARLPRAPAASPPLSLGLPASTSRTNTDKTAKNKEPTGKKSGDKKNAGEKKNAERKNTDKHRESSGGVSQLTDVV